MLPGSSIRAIERKTQGVGLQSGRHTFWGSFCILSCSSARKEHLIPIHQCKMTDESQWNGQILVAQKGWVVLRWHFQENP